MKNLLRYFLALSTLALVLPSVNGNASAADTGIKRVVLIGVDGGGSFFKDADTPNMDRIFKNGAITYDCVTSKPTISAQSWGSMLHGVTPEFHGLTNGIAGSRPYPVDSPFPSVFRVIRENMPNATLASICHWNPINIGIIEDNLGVVKEHAGGDSEVTDLVCAYLEKNDPTFLFVHFDDCDGAGHSKGYGSETHMKQLHTTDGYVQRIYEALEKRGWVDSTLFIVTADHGGTPQGSHGGWTDAEKYIMFAATGPGVEPGGKIGEMGVRDTSAVVLYGLGLADKQPETWTARVPSGLFKGVVAKERPVYVLKPAFAHREHASSATPTGADSVAAKLGKDRVRAYFTFDGDVKDALGKVKTTMNGKLYFVDGYFGKSATFDDGYVAVDGCQPGKSSFSVAFWMKTPGVDDDPAIISNKDWRNGTLPGFILSLRGNDIKFNVGGDGKRMDKEFSLPFDYTTGWIYVVAVVDREAGELRFSYDFAPFTKVALSDEVKGFDFSAGTTVNIGQDGTGKYRVGLGATLDEFLIIDGALTDADVATLKAAYQAR
ncbi:MAG: alkaline phosphatase family protein [Thermoguttaceae bacterium]|nr:alkaline phosphatase family protein [Thermoguttaceae bacterium]